MARKLMRRDRRLTRSRDFATVRREGRARSDRFLVVVSRRNGLLVTRAGFPVGRRIGNAVVRNRIKRRLREAIRLAPLEQGWDLVVIARRDAASADFRTLSNSVTALLGNAGILEAARQHGSSPRRTS